MDYCLESMIWKEAQATFRGEAFTDAVELAVSSYLRRPGHHEGMAKVGESGLRATLETLSVGRVAQLPTLVHLKRTRFIHSHRVQ